MKIAINGEIIDTESIYKISKVTSSYRGGSYIYYISFEFNIFLFNRKEIQVYNQVSIYLDKHSSLMTGYSEVIKHNATKEDLENHPIYIEALSKISNLRDEIIKIWSNNQSSIPQFNLE